MSFDNFRWSIILSFSTPVLIPVHVELSPLTPDDLVGWTPYTITSLSRSTTESVHRELKGFGINEFQDNRNGQNGETRKE